MAEEALEVGRILGGSTKRSNIAQKIKEIARSKGMKPSQVIEEAIAVYEMIENFGNVDAKCLIIGLEFANRVMENAVNVLNNVAKLFTSEMTSHYLGAIMKGYEYAKSSTQQTQQQTTSEVPQDLRQTIMTLISNVMNMVTSLLMGLMNTMVSTMTGGRVSLPVAQTSTTQTAQLQGVKIE
jgi:DNA polymerase III delta prime subunit